MILPKHYSIVSGLGESEYPLVAFDNALLNAGIGDYNLVQVSSILPPKCTYKEQIDIPKGSILFAAYAYEILKFNQHYSVAVATAIPKQPDKNGVIFETSEEGSNAKENACKMCQEAMKNRDRDIKEIKSSCIEVKGKENLFVCGISAIVMW